MDRAGKYQIVEQIGAGGFSEVYKGFDPHIKRHVAIKTCTANDPELRSRFFQEGQIAGNLQHRNIVTVFDFGFEGDMPYLVQEYLSGEDLDRKVKRGDLIPLSVKVDILHQVALGLQHAHEQSIVHRDIKPGNVRVLEDGTTKIMDFGIAKILQQDTGLTKTGMTVGTAAYLAPEQIRGRSADPRTDVFSFGVLAYELLTLSRPFAGEQISAVLYQILNEEPHQLVAKVQDCPPKLAALVMRCLRKEPDDRPANGGALVKALEAIGKSLTATPEPAPSASDITKPFSGAQGVGHMELQAGSSTFAKTASALPVARKAAKYRWPAVLLAGLVVVAAIAWLARNELMPDRFGASQPPDPAAAADPSTATSPSPADPASPGGAELARPGETAPDLSADDPGAVVDDPAPDPPSEPATDATFDAAPPPPPPPPPLPPPPATVVIAPAWEPSITVAIDGGTPKPLTRSIRQPLTPGSHSLLFRIDVPGYRQTRTVEIEARAGERHAVDVPFAPAGRLLIQAKPGGFAGMVRIGGEPAGEGRRVTVGFIAPGSHNLEISPLQDTTGARTILAKVIVLSGEETIVTYDLESAEPPTIRQRNPSSS